MNLPIKDIKFISAKQLDMDKDVILLRIPIALPEGSVDAVVRLDVQCYVMSDMPDDLLDILVKSDLPKRIDEAWTDPVLTK